ncbi:hypothetical protein V5P93_003734 [Actinokineospora auranticolor]|uniref:Uncharacterized protein n=1 Tax=Actinokineospora auranticolor TaxID=155976 RepID=A0A2S6GJG9_9PSEU|nr:hypothetical protein [Actinokineospora auranticolor]PPK65296.1 hypothetical protein CLV40_115143 [Actinokineospora auranticolor]
MDAAAVVESARVPAAVRVARVLLAVVAASHLGMVSVLWANRGSVAGSEVVSGSVFHGFLVLLCAVLVWRLASGRAWTRRMTSMSQVVSAVAMVVTWSSSGMFHGVIPALDVVQLVVVALLWVPRSARAFFSPGG